MLEKMEEIQPHLRSPQKNTIAYRRRQRRTTPLQEAGPAWSHQGARRSSPLKGHSGWRQRVTDPTLWCYWMRRICKLQRQISNCKIHRHPLEL